MKILISLLAFYLITSAGIAQTPQKFSYQSVIRNESNQLVSNQTVGIKISVLQGSANGSAVYAETHNPLTNANGLATLEIGGGSVLSGNFANINWANGPYFVKTETDLNGGSNFTITSTTQLLSVPYALYSGNGIPVGGTNGQFLTNCNGVPTWTTNGNCPFIISSLLCSEATNSGSLTENWTATEVNVNIPYIGGNGGTYSGQAVNSSSTGVFGLTATLITYNFALGEGVLTYAISGTPTSSGIASFVLNIGGESCTITLTVNDSPGASPASCGAANIHNPDKTYGSMTDQQGNVYKTIVIGTQEWMAENLKTSIYRNGVSIANITNGTQWTNLTTGAWCYYNNEMLYDCPYGKLYNWYAVADPRNICPTGWHVPTDGEWTTLSNNLGDTLVAGGKMKTTGTQYWNTPNLATNESGFSALPGGSRSIQSGGLGTSGFWWSSTENESWNNVWGRYLFSNSARLALGAGNDCCDKQLGLSVRCIRD